MKSLRGPRTSTMWCCDRRGKETAVSSRAANVNIQIFYFFFPEEINIHNHM